MYTTACPMATLQMGRKTWRARPRRKHWRFWRQIPPTTRLGGEPFRKARKENSSSWGKINSSCFADRGDDGLAAETFVVQAGWLRNNGETRKRNAKAQRNRRQSRAKIPAVHSILLHCQ